MKTAPQVAEKIFLIMTTILVGRMEIQDVALAAKLEKILCFVYDGYKRLNRNPNAC